MVNVAILGFGTVGSGVAEVLTTNGGLIDQRVENLVRLKYILDVRDFSGSPDAALFTTAWPADSQAKAAPAYFAGRWQYPKLPLQRPAR